MNLPLANSLIWILNLIMHRLNYSKRTRQLPKRINQSHSRCKNVNDLHES